MNKPPVPDTVFSGSSFKEVTVRGLYWSLAASLVKQILNFIIGVILARLLSPNEFGLLGMVLVFTGFVNLFAGQGLGAAIVQKRDVDDRHLDSIFWLSVLLGAVCTAFLIFAAPWVAVFYHEPVLRPLTAFISVTFLAGALGLVPSTLLNRALDFRKLALIETVASLCAGALGIFLALRGFGVWSLAWQSVALVFLTSFLMWSISSWRPQWRWGIAAVRELIDFALHSLGSSVLGFLTRNIDNLLIGRYLSAHALGIYSKAYQLMLLPLNQVSWVVSRVMFPALSAIQHDLEKVRRVYLRSTRAIALITFPLMIGLFVVSQRFVLCLFGDQWIGMVPLLQILCWQGMLQSINTSFGWIYNSQGRPDLQFRWGLVATPVIIGAFIVGLRWGTVGVAYGYLFSGILLFYPDWALAGRVIRLRFSDMLRNLLGPFYASVVMGTAVWLLDLILPSAWADWERLAVQVLFGAGVYWFLVHALQVEAYMEVKKVFADRLSDGGTEEKSEAPDERPVVAHLHSIFFQRSETFVYNLIANHIRFRPLCVAGRFENLHEFPFPAGDRFEVMSQGVLAKAFRRLIGVNREKERFLRERGADLLHAHFGPNGFAALKLKRHLGLPLVTTFYGYDVSELALQPLWVSRYQALFQQGDLFLAEGECMRSKLERLGCPAGKIRLQRITIPLSRMRFSPRGPKRSGEKTVIIFGGRFVEKKGLLDALEAMRRLRERRSDFEFQIIGDGPLRAKIEAFVERHSMGPYVKFLGFLNYDDYLETMSRADIFVHPSVTASNGDDEGGAPATILAAQAVGMPIVSTYHADIPNVVVDGKSALLCREHDIEQLSGNIERLLDHPESWAAMGLEGRRFVEAHHDLKRGIENLEGIYSEVLAAKRG